MLPFEIQSLILKFRGNIKPPHFFVFEHYLKIQTLIEEIADINRYFLLKENEMFHCWYSGCD